MNVLLNFGLFFFLLLPVSVTAQHVFIEAGSAFPGNKYVQPKKLCSGAKCDGPCNFPQADYSFELTVTPRSEHDTITRIVVGQPNGADSTYFEGESNTAVVRDVKVATVNVPCDSFVERSYTVSVYYKTAATIGESSAVTETFVYKFFCDLCPEDLDYALDVTGNGLTFVPQSPDDQWASVQFSLLNHAPPGTMDLIALRLVYLQPTPHIQELPTISLLGGGDTSLLVPIWIPAGTPSCTVFQVVLEAWYVSGAGQPAKDVVVVEITPVEVPELTFEVVPVSCFGGSDGMISVHIEGQTPPFLFSWDNGLVGPVIAGLKAGVYRVVIRDDNLCSARLSFLVVPEAYPLDDFSVEVTPATAGLNNGSVQATGSGGTPPYLFQWTNEFGEIIANTAKADGLAPGLYTLDVTDANGCTAPTITVLVSSIVHVQAAEQGGTLRVFPNPTNGRIGIELDNIPNGPVAWTLADIAGRVCSSGTFRTADSYRETLDLTGLPAGMYLLHLVLEGQNIVRPVVLNRH